MNKVNVFLPLTDPSYPIVGYHKQQIWFTIHKSPTIAQSIVPTSLFSKHGCCHNIMVANDYINKQ